MWGYACVIIKCFDFLLLLIGDQLGLTEEALDGDWLFSSGSLEKSAYHFGCFLRYHMRELDLNISEVTSNCDISRLSVLHVVAFHSTSHRFLWLGDTADMERNNVLFNIMIALSIIIITDYIHDLDYSFSKPFGICYCT